MISAQMLAVTLHGLRLRGDSHAADIIDGLVREMHERELHHFEAEAALSRVLAVATKSHSQSWLSDLEEIAGITRKALGGSDV
jgi:hypothetical protein